MWNNVGVGLLCWLTCANAPVEPGHLRQSAGALPPSLLCPPPLLSSSPLTQIWCLFFFGGAPIHHLIRKADVWDRTSPPRESDGESGALLSVSFWVITMWREEEGGGCLFLKHDSSSKLVTVILYCQLHSYYSLIESSHRR